MKPPSMPKPTRAEIVTPATPFLDAVEVQKALAVMVEPGQVFEVRILDPRRARGYSPRVFLGYFDNPALVPDTLAALHLEGAKGIYLTMNPVDPALLARSHNKFIESKGGDCAGDKDILVRRWLLVDVDPKRKPGISATDNEKAQAHAKSKEVLSYLRLAGWPEPLEADSGNGYHLLYRINLPSTSETVKQCLEALNHRFTDDAVGVDTTVHNAARICKLYGTLSGKGDHCPDLGRPHRQSRLLSVPDRIEVVSEEQLETLAATAKPETPSKAPVSYVNGTGTGWDQPRMQEWIDRHLGAYQPGPATPYDGGHKWVLAVCPFNSDHNDRSAVVVIKGDGKLGFHCHHDGCKAHDWKALRAKFDPIERSSASTTTPAPATDKRIISVEDFALLDQGRFDINHPPEKPIAVISLKGQGLSTPGNLTMLQAKNKTAKTTVKWAAIASMMEPSGDCLGFTGTWTGGAWVHFDTEQSPHDFDRAERVALRRAGRDTPPDWLRAYSTVRLDIAKRRELFFAELERAYNEWGKLSGASVDGIADLCRDPNDPDESFAFVARLHRAAVQYECPILLSLHENPGSETGKTRGHLGSELARKAETNLQLVKDDKGIVTMFSEQSRSIYIAKASGLRFAWDDDAGMFLSIESAREASTPKVSKYDVQSLLVVGQEIAKESLISKANDSTNPKKMGILKAKGFISELIDDGILKVIEKSRARTNPAIFLERVL